MIIIKDHHIISLADFASSQEQEEFDRLIEAGLLRISPACVQAFRDGSVQSDTIHLPRHYEDHGQEDSSNLCAGGSLGKCQPSLPKKLAVDAVQGEQSEHTANSDGLDVAARMPPELFPLLAERLAIIAALTTPGHRPSMYQLSKSDLTKLCLVCRYWTTLYRPLVWRTVRITSREDLYNLLDILQTPTPGYLSVAEHIQSLEVRANGIPNQPWIHLVPIVLQNRLRAHTNLTLHVSSANTGNGRVQMHATHDSVPRSLAALNSHTRLLELRGVVFRDISGFLRFVRAFRRLEDLSCDDTLIDRYPTALRLCRVSSPYLKHLSMRPWPRGDYLVPLLPRPGLISMLWSHVRMRLYQSDSFLLEDAETMLAMRLTSLFQAFFNIKHEGTLEVNVRERFATNREGEVNLLGYDFCFTIDYSMHEFVISTVADDASSVFQGPGQRTYRALHVHYIVVCFKRNVQTSRTLETIANHTKICELAIEFPNFEKLVYGLEHDSDDLLNPLFEKHGTALRGVANLILARTNKYSWEDDQCMWQRLDTTTLEPTGQVCRWYHDSNPQSPDNVGGLSALWT